MAIEIERKFRVAGDAWRAVAEAGPKRYRQAYLAISDRAVVRVRVEKGAAAAWLCIKEHKVGAARAEFEYPVPTADARALLRLATGEVVEKYRHLAHVDGHVWEVDEFLGANAGLLVAEIELGTEDESFSRPDWLGAEVTRDERYYNANLAMTPFRDWEANSS
ncbi:MAG: CYTH domain-containing protein [Gammaproteobacteria bacterium]|nr:CYTH domain-containing protein [Gammaproteobacteria bacterium]